MATIFARCVGDFSLNTTISKTIVTITDNAASGGALLQLQLVYVRRFAACWQRKFWKQLWSELMVSWSLDFVDVCLIKSCASAFFNHSLTSRRACRLSYMFLKREELPGISFGQSFCTAVLRSEAFFYWESNASYFNTLKRLKIVAEELSILQILKGWKQGIWLNTHWRPPVADQTFVPLSFVHQTKVCYLTDSGFCLPEDKCVLRYVNLTFSNKDCESNRTFKQPVPFKPLRKGSFFLIVIASATFRWGAGSRIEWAMPTQKMRDCMCAHRREN